jgi:hypothetical protein
MEQVKAGAAIHLPFDHLEAAHLLLGLAVRPLEKKRGSDRSQILI